MRRSRTIQLWRRSSLLSILLLLSFHNNNHLVVAAEELIFADEFDYTGGEIDSSIWTFDLGDGSSTGWGNQEALQSYTQDNVFVSHNGTLILRALRGHSTNNNNNDIQFTSGRVKTSKRVSFQYGRIETSIKVPNLQDGLWPVFGTLGSSFPTVAWPACGVVNALEMGHLDAMDSGRLNRRVSSSTMGGTIAARGHGFIDAPTNLHLDFHNYTLQWTPTWLHTYVDGHVILSKNITDCCQEFHQPHFILFHLAVGGLYTGLLSPEAITAKFPAQLEIDYIRLYANKWTTVGGSYFGEDEAANYAEDGETLDCGCPNTCTIDGVLSRPTTDEEGTFSCQERIVTAMSRWDANEKDACTLISFEFPDICGVGCHPYECSTTTTSTTPPTAKPADQSPPIKDETDPVPDCGCPECYASKMDADDTSTCRDQIDMIMTDFAKVEDEACYIVSAMYPETCGIVCDPFTCELGWMEPPEPSVGGNDGKVKDCGCPLSCTDTVLNRNATDGVGSFDCRSRIEWVMANTNFATEQDACARVSLEFPTICGNGCNPSTCNEATSAAVDDEDDDDDDDLAVEDMSFTRRTGRTFDSRIRRNAPIPTKDPPRPPTTTTAAATTRSSSMIDCGCPDSCTTNVLSQIATDDIASISCHDRIVWAMNNLNLSEESACASMSSKFPDSCGNGCNPTTCQDTPTPTTTMEEASPAAAIDCGCPASCTSEALGTMASDGVASISCGERIQWAMNNQKVSQEEACLAIGNRFPTECGGPECDPNQCATITTTEAPVSVPTPRSAPTIPVSTASSFLHDCGCPSTCTDIVLSRIATDGGGSYDCRSRIEWVMSNTEFRSETAACSKVSSEFPSICGNGCDPNHCPQGADGGGGGGFEVVSPTPPSLPPQMPPTQPPKQPVGQLVFAEEFDQGDRPNPDIWSYDYGDWGWGNAELQRYTDQTENVQLRNGKLIITAIRRGNLITSGRIKTLDKFTFKYGSVEASIKVPDLRNGLWPAFWTLGNSFPIVGWPKCGEIDIMEMGNAAPGNNILNQRVGSAAHWFDDPNGRATYGLYLDAGQDLTQGFHKFSMDWTPDMITTYVDGKQIWAIDISPEKCPHAKCSEFHDHHFFLLNLAVGGSYTNLLLPNQITAPFPAQYEIDYIRIYKNEWTELGGSFTTNRGGSPSKHVLTDCGCPTTCTFRQLSRLTQDSSGIFTCRDRIEWVIGNLGSTEKEACRVVSDEFPWVCGLGCNPETCS